MRRRRSLTCRQVDDRLMAYLKDGLSTAERQAVADHCAVCEACSRALADARALDVQLRLEANRVGPALSHQAATRLQARIDRTLRRRQIMQRISKSSAQALGLLVTLVALVGVWVLSQEPRGAGQPAGGSGGDVTLTFAAFELQRDEYETLARQFKAETGIEVRFRSFGEILGKEDFDWATDARQIAGGADAFGMQLNQAAIRQGVLLPLDTFIAADAGFDRDDFFPAALASARAEDATWLVPSTLVLDMIVYDKAAFDQAGLPYPKPGWTWDEFLTAAQTLTTRDGDETTRWGYVPGVIDVTPLLDRPADQITLTDPQVALAVSGYAGLTLEHHIAPLTLSGDDRFHLIEQRQAAMWSNWQPAVSLQSRLAAGEIGIVPFPVSAIRQDTTSAFVAGYALSAGTRQPQAAWRWLVFLSKHAASSAGATLPARQTLANAGAFWNNLDGDSAAAYRFAVEHAHPGLYGFAGVRGLTQALDDVLRGVAVDTALATAQAKMNETLGALPAAPDSLVVSTPAPSAEAAARIRFVYSWDPLSSNVYETLASEFNQDNPGVRINPAPISSNDPTFELAAATSDCFVWQNGAGIPLGSEPGRSVIGLQPLIDADPTFPRDDFYAVALDAFRAQGELYALPVEFQPIAVLQYDKSLFDAAGLDYPQPGWTLDDFRTAAIALTQGSGEQKQYGYLSLWLEAGTDALWVFAPLHGAFYLDVETGLPRPHFADPATVAAVQWYADLVNQSGLDRVEGEDPQLRWPATYDTTTGDLSFEQRNALVEQGRVAMWRPAFLEAYPEAVAPLPLDDDGYIPGFFDGFYISAKTSHVETCWQWLRFLSDRSAQFARYAPARRSALDSSDYANRVGTEFAAAMRFSVEHTSTRDAAHVLADQLGAQHYYTWLAAAGRSIYLQERDAGLVMNELQQKVDAYIACLDARQGWGDIETQDACASPAGPTP